MRTGVKAFSRVCWAWKRRATAANAVITASIFNAAFDGAVIQSVEHPLRIYS